MKITYIGVGRHKTGMAMAKRRSITWIRSEFNIFIIKYFLEFKFSERE